MKFFLQFFCTLYLIPIILYYFSLGFTVFINIPYSESDYLLLVFCPCSVRWRPIQCICLRRDCGQLIGQLGTS